MSILNAEHWNRMGRCVSQYKKRLRQRTSVLFDGEEDHRVLSNPRNRSNELDIDDVRTIRKMYAGGEKLVVIAHIYDVSIAVISKIVNRQTWRELM
ncbi:MAG: hypothetical protein JSR92_19790 [Proteobacteria bacterium]|nr:hypothetical protein [Pseudomonadota bacterium]